MNVISSNVDDSIYDYSKCCACNARVQDGLRFPRSAELRQKWVDIIMRNTPDYPGKRRRLAEPGIQICLYHFDENVLIRKGSEDYALRKGGVPSIFTRPQPVNGNGIGRVTNGHTEEDEISICYEMVPRTPEAQGSRVTESETNRTPVSNNENECIDVNECDTSDESDKIFSLERFVTVLKLKEPRYFHPWQILFLEDSVVFCRFDEQYKQLVQSFTVNKNLQVMVTYHGQMIEHGRLTPILGAELCVNTWTKFKNLILFLHNIMKQRDNVTTKLNQVYELLQECIDQGCNFGFTEKETKKWKFSQNQIEMSHAVDPNYSKDNVKWAFDVYNANKQGYIKIYNSDVMKLPHPASLELYRKQLRPQQIRRLPSTAISSTAISSTAIPSTAIPSIAIPSTASPKIAAIPSTASPKIASPKIASTNTIIVNPIQVPAENGANSCEIIIDDDIIDDMTDK